MFGGGPTRESVDGGDLGLRPLFFRCARVQWLDGQPGCGVNSALRHATTVYKEGRSPALAARTCRLYTPCRCGEAGALFRSELSCFAPGGSNDRTPARKPV